MICPKCAHSEIKVLESRDSDHGKTTRRRRKCANCKYRFTTYESVEVPRFTVLKRDHTSEPYSHDKLMLGIVKACVKLPIEHRKIEKIVDKIEESWIHDGLKEITTERIGTDVLQELKQLNDVAFIRFASVYKAFKDLDTFKKELQSLNK